MLRVTDCLYVNKDNVEKVSIDPPHVYIRYVSGYQETKDISDDDISKLIEQLKSN